MSQPPRPVRPSYVRHWIVTLVLGALCIGGLAVVRHRRPPEPPVLPPPSERPYVGWFQLVGLPELLDNEPARRSAYQQMIRGWLEGVRGEGFLVLPMAMVVERLQNGEGVPEKTVVFVFEPGYRVTCEAVAPVLEEAGACATWITEDPGRYLTDRRFVPRHERNVMRRSGHWDVAMRSKDADGFRMEAAGGGRFLWDSDLGRYGINRAGEFAALRRLNANPAWSPRELADRMLAELPIEGPRPLVARSIQGRLWGTIPARDDARPAPFDLHADLSGRGASVSWLGTRGLADFALAFSVREVKGEFWMMLRSDPALSRRIYVGLAEERLVVDAEDGGGRRRLASLPFARPAGGALKGDLRIEGGTLRVACEGADSQLILDVGVAATADCILEMTALARLRGVAQASGIELRIEPLGQGARPATPSAEGGT